VCDGAGGAPRTIQAQAAGARLSAEDLSRKLGDRVAGLPQRKAVLAPQPEEGLQAGEHAQRRGGSSLAQPGPKPVRASQAPRQALKIRPLLLPPPFQQGARLGLQDGDRLELLDDEAIGLYGYPVLMAADVLALDSDEVPVGADQAQHLEIAVDLARRFSRRYRPGVLREPRALIAQTTATLPGLDGRKMSKSYGNAVSLMAEPHDMRKQVRRIVTDSTPPAQAKDPDTCTLVALLRAFADPGTVAAVEERYRTGGIGYGEVKARLADAIDAHVAPKRNRYQRLLTDPAELDARLANGEQRARQRADRTLARTMVAMGL
jgi:tryptophanyl-tRNA synthetase